MGNQVITKPASEPLTLTEAKAHLNVDHDEDDTYITTLITVARRTAEGKQWRALMTTTREQTMDCFPFGCITLEHPPLQSVTSVKYIDADGVQQTLSSDNYDVDTDSIYGRICPAYGLNWPTTRNIQNAVRVRYDCGYADADSVPTTTKQAMLLLIGNWYEHREEVVVGLSVTKITDAVDMLLNQNSAKRFV
ncbi:MAG: hypothetical protein DHS20C16_03510 [Phycisphaerae bacterium]|nr:MAG: hypothetical protein DHS20C16_03510 [Phycisphaerae bacterium]